jgi:hypothetical protein
MTSRRVLWSGMTDDQPHFRAALRRTDDRRAGKPETGFGHADRQYLDFTIAVGSLYNQYSQLLEACEAVPAVLPLRRPNAETQFVIQEKMRRQSWDIPITKAGTNSFCRMF